MQQLQYSVDLDITNLNTYEIISSEFAETRAYVWQCVKDFTKLINENSSVLEIGCGNGKNMKYILDRIDCIAVGIDTCQNFVDMCKDKNLKVSNKNILNLEFDDNTFDYILCVAVFHHLLNIDDQDRAMNEILRVMKPKSIGMITCWSTEQPDDSKFIFSEGINIVMWKGRKDLNKTSLELYDKDQWEINEKSL
jgi:ubiquinone/menaquinone biosynthesis C-methylase UbiE